MIYSAPGLLTRRTRHIASMITWMRELKGEGKLFVKWMLKDDMLSDILTKNVGGADFEKHRPNMLVDN